MNSLVNYNTTPGTSFTNIFDQFFNRSLSDIIGADFTFSRPSVNITEDENGYNIAVAAPGLEKSDFNVEVNGDQLVISSTREESKETTGEKGKFTRKEFNYASFKRSFHLGDTIDKTSINAKYENGILAIDLAKKEEAKEKQPSVIEIQ